MKETYNAAKVGLLVLVTLVASIAIYRFVDEGSRGDEGYVAYAVFDDVQGLVEKSRVVVAGIPVGMIEKIRLQGDRARVDIRIQAGVKLYRDATVAQRSASLLGETLLVVASVALVDDGDVFLRMRVMHFQGARLAIGGRVLQGFGGEYGDEGRKNNAPRETRRHSGQRQAARGTKFHRLFFRPT
jgi:hypothetical protein